MFLKIIILQERVFQYPKKQEIWPQTLLQYINRERT